MVFQSLIHTSIYDASRLYDFIEERFKGTKPKKHLSIGITNFQNGTMESFHEFTPNEVMIKVL